MILTKIIKVLKNGMVVRYQEDAYSNGIICEKDYRLNGFPKTIQGNYDVSKSYDEYLDWLQDYLFHASVDLNEEEFRLSQQVQNEQRDMNYGAGLGVFAGFYDHFGPELEYPSDFEVSCDFATVATLGANRDNLDGDRLNGLSVDEFILQDYARHLIRQREGKEFEQYWPDFKRGYIYWLLPGFSDDTLVEPCDAGWRVHLSIYLKKFSDKTRRRKELDDFMCEFKENFRK